MNKPTRLLLGALAAGFTSACIAGTPGQSAALFSPSARSQPIAGEELGLTALEERLKETKAIPPLRKLALKAEIDDLLAKFRVAHAGGSPDLIALREPYDTLIVKIRGMLKDDPKLARDIVASKEAIWEKLADRTQFASLN